MDGLDERRRALAENNLRLVYYVLKKMGISRGSYDYDDLVEAGCVGLCNAARAWREDGSAFSTFAFNVIKHEVLSALSAQKRDRYKLMPLDECYEYIPGVCCGIEESEAKILLEEFFRSAKRNLSETLIAVIRLSMAGKSCAQIAEILGISLSAAHKAKRKARAEIELWLKNERERG